MVDSVNNDLPLDFEATQDLPLEIDFQSSKNTPESVQNMHKSHAAILKNANEGKGLIQSFMEVEADADPKALIHMMSMEKADMDRQEVIDQFENDPGVTPVQMGENAQITNEMINDIQAMSTEDHIIDALSTIETEARKAVQISNELLVVNTLTELVEDYTTMDKIADFGKAVLMVPGLLDNIEVSNLVEDAGFAGVFGAEDRMKQVLMGLKHLQHEEPEKFADVFVGIVDQLNEVLPEGKVLEFVAAVAGPFGEENLGSFSDLWAGIDAASLATLGGSLAVRAVQLSRKLNAIKMANDLKNKEAAVEGATAAVVDETGSVAKAVGIDDVTVVNNAQPFKVNELDDMYAEGLSADTINNINRVRRNQSQVVEDIGDETLLREGLLDVQERTIAENKQIKELETLGFEDIQVLSRSTDSTKFQYSLVEDGEKLTDTFDMDLTLDMKTGVWKETEMSSLTKFLASPTTFAKNASEDVQAALRLDSTSQVVASTLKQLQTDALRPLLGPAGLKGLAPSVRTQLAQIDEVLLAGDRATEVYTADKLKSGELGVSLNDTQIEAYYNLRGVYDSLWSIRNQETRRSLVARGFKEVRSSDDFVEVGRPFDQSGAQALVNSGEVTAVFDPASSKILTVGSKDVSDLYTNGFTIARLESPKRFGDAGDFDMVVVRANEVKQLPQKVIHFREGYVPKVNKDAYWFAKRFENRTINGRTSATKVPTETVRFFRTQKEATEWIAENPQLGDVRALPDRAMEQQVLGSSQVGSGGGLYTGARAREEILFGKQGLPAERFNAFEALSMNINSLDNFVSRNQWRMGLQQKWINSAQAAGFDIQRFEKALIPAGDPRGTGLSKLATQIEDWSGFPSSSELAWDSFVSRTIEFAMNRPFLRKDFLIDGLHHLRRRDPIGAMRATSFHSLLGMFNPVQLWVQAQGASLALTMATKLTDPAGGIRAVKNQMALGLIDHMNSPEAFNRVAKAFAMSPEELTEIKRLWDKTGYRVSILNTADHAASATGYGIARDALRRVADKGLFFYRAGELFNRRTSFLVALEEYKQANKLGRGAKISDDGLKQIMTRANNFMLNLSKANRAQWQKGAWSLPTQFLQVQAKTVESLILGSNKTFTAGERLKLLTGQLALYGAAGIPLGNLGLRWAAEQLGVDQATANDLPKGAVKFLNEGLWGLYVFQALGADVDIASRGAIASGLEVLASDLMFSDASIVEKMFGAFGTIPHRFYNAYTVLKPMSVGALFHGADPTAAEIRMGVNSILGITSTWNNYQKGLFMERMNMLIDSRGNIIAEDDFNFSTELATKIGFQPAEARRTRDRELMVRASKDYRKQVTDTLLNTYWRYIVAIKDAETEAEKQKLTKNFEIANLVIAKSLRNQGEVQKVNESLLNRIRDGRDRQTRSIKAFLREFNNEQTLAYGTIVSSLQAQGIIRDDLFDEDDL